MISGLHGPTKMQFGTVLRGQDMSKHPTLQLLQSAEDGGVRGGGGGKGEGGGVRFRSEGGGPPSAEAETMVPVSLVVGEAVS